jgi:hypothetical protein
LQAGSDQAGDCKMSTASVLATLATFAKMVKAWKRGKDWLDERKRKRKEKSK